MSWILYQTFPDFTTFLFSNDSLGVFIISRAEENVRTAAICPTSRPGKEASPISPSIFLVQVHEAKFLPIPYSTLILLLKVYSTY
jgi:hypothetical protein